MPFIFTDDPHFYVLEMSLSNILMIDLFRSNYRMVIFSKTEKRSYHSKQLHLRRPHRRGCPHGEGGS